MQHTKQMIQFHSTPHGVKFRFIARRHKHWPPQNQQNDCAKSGCTTLIGHDACHKTVRQAVQPFQCRILPVQRSHFKGRFTSAGSSQATRMVRRRPLSMFLLLCVEVYDIAVKSRLLVFVHPRTSAIVAPIPYVANIFFTPQMLLAQGL